MTLQSDVVQSSYDKALNYVRNKIPEPDCYDLAQECVVAFFEKDPHTIEKPNAFFWGIVHNKIKQYYGNRSRLVAATGVYDMLPVALMATRLSSKIARRHDLDEALQKLPLRYQQAFELRYMQGLSLDECVQVLDRSLATIKRDIEAAKRGLVEQLGRPLDQEGDAHALVRSYLERRY